MSDDLVYKGHGNLGKKKSTQKLSEDSKSLENSMDFIKPTTKVSAMNVLNNLNMFDPFSRPTS